MTQRSVNRLINRLLLTTSLVLALPAAANAVPVLFGGGNVTVNGAPYSGGDLPSGAEIVVTGSLLQLQLADGSTISVPEGSSFRVTGEGDTLSIELVSGSMRVDSKGTPISITRNGTTISTSDGTFSAFASEAGGLDGRVNSGSATVVAGGETRSFAAGQGYVASNTGISGTFTPPSTQTPQFAQNDTSNDPNYTPADERGNSEGLPNLLLVTLDEIGAGGGGNGGGDGGGPDTPEHVDTTPGVASGSVSASLGAGTYAMAYAAHDIGLDVREGVTADFNGSGELNEYSWGSSENLERGTNLTAELAGDELVSVGRWNGGTTAGAYYSAPDFIFGGQEGFHYAIGLQTVTPITSGTATYTLQAATKPTFGDGLGAPGTLTGDMAVSFGLTTRIGLDLSVDMPGDHVYTIRSTGGVTNVATSEIELSNTDWTDTGPIFYAHLPVADGGRACQRAGMCDAGIRGFFAGDNAEGIGLSYQIGDSGGPSVNSIYGAAYFKGAGVMGGGGGGGGTSQSTTGDLKNNWQVAFGLLSVDVRHESEIYIENDDTVNSWRWTAANGSYGRGLKTIEDQGGVADVLAWSRWGVGTPDLYNNTPGEWQEFGTANAIAAHYHVITGEPVTNLPVGSSADYDLIGGTQPTIYNDPSSPGTLTAAALRVDFAAQRVGLTLEASHDGNDWLVQTPGGLAGTAADGMQLVAQGSVGFVPPDFFYGNNNGAAGFEVEVSLNASPCGACQSDIRGFLAGDGASHAGLTYRLAPTFGSQESLIGAAAFAKVP